MLCWFYNEFDGKLRWVVNVWIVCCWENLVILIFVCCKLGFWKIILLSGFVFIFNNCCFFKVLFVGS